MPNNQERTDECWFGPDCGDMHCTGTTSEGCFPSSGVGTTAPATAVFFGCRNSDGVNDEAHQGPSHLVVFADPGGLVFVHIECAACKPEGYYENAAEIFPNSVFSVHPLFPTNEGAT